MTAINAASGVANTMWLVAALTFLSGAIVAVRMRGAESGDMQQGKS